MALLVQNLGRCEVRDWERGGSVLYGSPIKLIWMNRVQNQYYQNFHGQNKANSLCSQRV